MLARIRDGLAHRTGERIALIPRRRRPDLAHDELDAPAQRACLLGDELQLGQQVALGRQVDEVDPAVQVARRAAGEVPDLLRCEAGAEVVARDELEDLQGGVVQMAPDPLALLVAGGIVDAGEAEEHVAVVGALELGAQPARLAIGECDQVGGRGGGIDELLEPGDDVRAHMSEQALALESALAADALPARWDRTTMFGVRPLRPPLLPLMHTVPAFSIRNPRGLQKKECFRVQPYARVLAVVNPSVRFLTRQQAPGVPQ